MVKLCQTSLLFLSLFLLSGHAKAIEFGFPVACQVMGNCWITNHVDLDDRIGRTDDYMCGEKATDNNRSTHISLGSINAMENNIPVIAAADGVIEFSGNQGGFCGYRILIQHDDGWESNYCHLKPGTLQHNAGDTIKRGEIIAAVGMSGQADWPRLSFATTRNGMVFDPFSGRTSIEGCSATTNPLWIDGMNPPYEPAAVVGAGFTIGHVTNNEIMAGTAEIATAISTQTPQLSLWSLMMNLRTGDKIHMSITTPAGRILNEMEQTIDTDTPRYPLYFSTLRKGFLWDAGEYQGVIKITRRVNGNDIVSGRIIPLEMQ